MYIQFFSPLNLFISSLCFWVLKFDYFFKIWSILFSCFGVPKIRKYFLFALVFIFFFKTCVLVPKILLILSLFLLVYPVSAKLVHEWNCDCLNWIWKWVWCKSPYSKYDIWILYTKGDSYEIDPHQSEMFDLCLMKWYIIIYNINSKWQFISWKEIIGAKGPSSCLFYRLFSILAWVAWFFWRKK